MGWRAAHRLLFLCSFDFTVVRAHLLAFFHRKNVHPGAQYFSHWAPCRLLRRVRRKMRWHSRTVLRPWMCASWIPRLITLLLLKILLLVKFLQRHGDNVRIKRWHIFKYFALLHVRRICVDTSPLLTRPGKTWQNPENHVFIRYDVNWNLLELQIRAVSSWILRIPLQVYLNFVCWRGKYTIHLVFRITCEIAWWLLIYKHVYVRKNKK